MKGKNRSLDGVGRRDEEEGRKDRWEQRRVAHWRKEVSL